MFPPKIDERLTVPSPFRPRVSTPDFLKDFNTPVGELKATPSGWSNVLVTSKDHENPVTLWSDEGPDSVSPSRVHVPWLLRV